MRIASPGAGRNRFTTSATNKSPNNCSAGRSRKELPSTCNILISAVLFCNLLTCPITTSPTTGRRGPSVTEETETEPSVRDTTPTCVAISVPSTSVTPAPASPDSSIFSPGVTNFPSLTELDMRI